MELQDRVALITGAGSGIAKASAELLARHGACIGGLDHNLDNVQQVVDQIKSTGGRAIALRADISQPAEVQEAVARIVSNWGRLDIVFANAGINGVWAPLEELTPEDWDQTLNVNLKGTFLTIKYAAPYLKKQGGSIIITSSVNGTRIFSNTGATAYSCSKAGQVVLAKMLAVELARWRVRVNVICPGSIETNISESTERRDLEKVQIPVKYPEGGRIPLSHDKPGTPEQVAQLVLFLASDASNHISGTEMWIDGAQSLVQG